MQDILITAKSSIASVGHESEQVWHSYKSEKSALTMCCFGGEDTPVGKLQPESEKKIVDLRREKVSYRRLDKSVLLALWASRSRQEEYRMGKFKDCCECRLLKGRLSF